MKNIKCKLKSDYIDWIDPLDSTLDSKYLSSNTCDVTTFIPAPSNGSILISVEYAIRSELCTDSCPYSENCLDAKDKGICLKDRIIKRLKDKL